MVQSNAQTVEQYLKELPPERREVIEAVRKVILKNLDKNFAEHMQYGMIGYCLPHSVYPAGYHCDPSHPLPFAGLAAQKNAYSLYLMCIYGDGELEAQLRDAFAAIGKKADMGKACIRFKKLEDLPLAAIGKMIKGITAKKYIARYEAAREAQASRSAPSKQAKSSKKR
jgi:uncharacterized protein YdhG (YjbR/CyaY superfamily)